MRKFNALARLFRRTENPVIAQIYTHAINAPLFVEPTLGEQLLGAYMAGAVDYDISRDPHRMQRVAILEISGALASRPMPGPSGSGPQNYEELRGAFDQVMDDATIDAVVLRMDSPGGFANGLFDLTDHIFSRRGEKPMAAVVDDIAYSAAYAIASAAGDIWVSRTGGVGSVGVVSYHVDQSEYDSQMGLKVTPIYAGARKIDFSPHFPLSDEAKRREQEIVDRLYAMFTDAVHRYRGMAVEDIENTEADIFHGQQAIDVGFADRLGTLSDAIEHLAAAETTTEPQETPAMSNPESPEATAPEKTEIPETPAQAAAETADKVMTAILSSQLPSNLQVTLLKANLQESDVESRIEHAKSIRDLCATAKMDRLAETFVAANAPIDHVREALVDHAAESQDKVDVTLPNLSGGPAAPKFSTQQVYDSRREQVEKLTAAR